MHNDERVAELAMTASMEGQSGGHEMFNGSRFKAPPANIAVVRLLSEDAAAPRDIDISA